MYRKNSGFTLIELIVVMAVIAIAVTLATPTWEQVSHKRKLTSATEQLAALLVVAQSEAQKRNQEVSLAFKRDDTQEWCVAADLGADGCDCRVTDPESEQFCTVDGTENRIEASAFPSLELIAAMDSTGDSLITFDPVRGILKPLGDGLQLTLESGRGYYRLRLSIGPTGLLSICNPVVSKSVSGYPACAT